MYFRVCCCFWAERGSKPGRRYGVMYLRVVVVNPTPHRVETPPDHVMGIRLSRWYHMMGVLSFYAKSVYTCYSRQREFCNPSLRGKVRARAHTHTHRTVVVQCYKHPCFIVLCCTEKEKERYVILFALWFGLLLIFSVSFQEDLCPKPNPKWFTAKTLEKRQFLAGKMMQLYGERDQRC